MKMRKVERPEFAHFLEVHPELEGKAVSTVSDSYAFAPHLSAMQYTDRSGTLRAQAVYWQGQRPQYFIEEEGR